MPSLTASRNETEQRWPGELQPALVRLLDRGAQRFAADVGVGLEPRHAFVRPVVDDAPRFFGLTICAIVAAPPGAGEIRARQVHARARDLTAVDPALHVDLVIRRRAARWCARS